MMIICKAREDEADWLCFLSTVYLGGGGVFPF